MRSDKCSDEPSRALSQFSTVLSAHVNMTGLIPISIHSSFIFLREAKHSFEYVHAVQLTPTDNLDRRRLAVRAVGH